MDLRLAVVIENYDFINNLKLVQSVSGVKASIDSLLLARFIKPSPGWKIADLGCGNGLVGLLLAMENPHCRLLAADIQSGLIIQARKSAILNGLSNIQFLQADLRRSPWPESLHGFDMVLANPPYRKVGTGRTSPDPVRAAARHEVYGDVSDFARSAASLLRDGGASGWIYLAERLDDLVAAVQNAGLSPVRRRFVVSREGQKASLILLEALMGHGIGSVYEEEPLVLYRSGSGRDYTDEAREIIYGKSDEESEVGIQEPE
ncbi:MAG: methyltransferase [Pseudomonadota bacterium]